MSRFSIRAAWWREERVAESHANETRNDSLSNRYQGKQGGRSDLPCAAPIPPAAPRPPDLCASRGDAPAPLRAAPGARIFHPCAAAGGSHGTGGGRRGRTLRTGYCDR